MKSEVLNEINNQCAIVQRSVAKNFESLENEGLITELLKLRKLLDEFLDS